MGKKRQGFIMPIGEAVPADGPGDTVKIQDEKGQVKIVKNRNKPLKKANSISFCALPVRMIKWGQKLQCTFG
jgi:hypothetical protein